MSNPRVPIAAETRFRFLVTTGQNGTVRNHLRWECRCDCGAIIWAASSDLMRGKIISCGCAKLKMMRVANLQHGASNTREWLSWKEMRRRCFNPTRPAYPNYGGRGITVCERWSDFSLFLSDMGPCPDGLTLERRDNSKGYEADNCHWASRTEQNRNTRRCIYVVYQGKRLALSAACEMAGVRYSRVYDRIKVLGWPIERALVGAAYA